MPPVLEPQNPQNKNNRVGEARPASPTFLEQRMTRRTFLRKLVSGMALAEGTALLATLYPLFLEPHWLDVSRVRIPIPGLPSDMEGLRVVQFSDVHLGPYMYAPFLRWVVRAIMAQSPDLILFTGDMVTRDTDADAGMARLLRGLRARLGVWGVLGNHDHWANPEVVHAFIEQHTPIRVLRNEHVPIRVGTHTLYLVGVDDAWVGADNPERAFSGVPEEAIRIVMMHEPDAVEWLPMTARTLQLSGHSHGGQIRLPLIGPPILPYLARKYDAGLYRIGHGWLYTNRGLGMISPPIRFNCRPEVTLFIFTRGAG